MQTVIDLKNIHLVSLNRGYKRCKNAFYTSDSYKDFKQLLVMSCRKGRIEPPYAVEISIEAYNDIDACIKIILDSLQQAGVIDNDKHVMKLNVTKQPTKRGQAGDLIVKVGTI
jgi:Holliday junction resolvase RusA-like endonuclease